ncbi:DMT family transporter [Loigolactobacillus coryniformis]|uniref:EamA family transporter n=1 Tax=Loigolactobacillus coryniformis TaxID=1610 RepID=A0A5B8TJ09_9LACO|nr:DMT family transporter [Loigolactobacillus coryniformis]QEA53146.1 EamA family transporter [Loigolactobacillus coryniformis]
MKRTYLYVLISTILFSSMEISLKLAGSAFNGIQLNFLRFLVGGLFLLPFAISALKKQHIHLTGRDLLLFMLTGLSCVLISMTFYQLAVEVDQASTVAVLFSCNPIFALIFSYLILRERLSRTNLIAVAVSLIGLLIIVNPAHLTNPLGLALSITSAVTFGLYSIISRWGSMRRKFNGLTMTSLTFLAGSAELAILMGLSHVPSIAAGLSSVPALKTFAAVPFIQGIAWQNILLLAYICIGVTAGGFGFYFLAMETSDVSTASLVFFIKPALAPIMAMFMLHEKIITPTIIGIVVIVLGSVIMFLGNRFAEQDASMQYKGIFAKLLRKPGTPTELQQKLAAERQELEHKKALKKNLSK